MCHKALKWTEMQVGHSSEVDLSTELHGNLLVAVNGCWLLVATATLFFIILMHQDESMCQPPRGEPEPVLS